MIIYHPTEEFKKKLEAGDLVLENISVKDNGAIIMKFSDDDKKVLNVRVLNPRAYENDELMENVPALAGARVRDFATYSIYSRGWIAPIHTVRFIIIEVDGKLITIKGDRP